MKAFKPIAYKIRNEVLENYDVAMLVDLLPVIDSGVTKIINAQLPDTLFISGEMQNEKIKWDNGVKNLQDVLNKFKTTIEKKDGEEILETAEELWIRYEVLFWLIYPTPEELELFYQAFHPIYYEHMPEYNINEIKLAVIEVQAKMDELNKIKIPQQVGRIQKLFYRERAELNRSVKYMIKVINLIDDEKTVIDAIKEVYEKYQALEKIFNQ
ncbi:MAG: hypothetical protein QME52_08875 [Bacteroidota bacterium]|nr:hypothetical protein [Bacteroidota bacterium]